MFFSFYNNDIIVISVGNSIVFKINTTCNVKKCKIKKLQAKK